MMRIVHSVLSHHPASSVDLMLGTFQGMAPGVRFHLAYGGTAGDFAEIQWRDKVFLTEPSLRGPVEEQDYMQWLCAAADWIRASGTEPDCVHFSECDHLPLRPDYWDELAGVLDRSGCDFLGKWCMDRSNSNEWGYLRHRDDADFITALRSLSPRRGEPVIWGALADGMVFRWRALDALTRCQIGVSRFTEILVPSAVAQLGFRLGDVDAFSGTYRWVRHRPAFDAALIRELIASGAACCHPFKDLGEIADVCQMIAGTGAAG